MTGSHCIMQLEIWGSFKFPLGPGQPLMGVQEAKPPKAPRDPALLQY